MNVPCITKALAAAAIASAGTYAGTTLTSGSPVAAAYTCPAGISASDCSYLTDLASVTLPIPSNALNAAGIICINLKSLTIAQEAQQWVLGHSNFTTAQAIDYITITQGDKCGV
jgi:hypothetical protein